MTDAQAAREWISGDGFIATNYGPVHIADMGDAGIQERLTALLASRTAEVARECAASICYGCRVGQEFQWHGDDEEGVHVPDDHRMTCCYAAHIRSDYPAAFREEEG